MIVYILVHTPIDFSKRIIGVFETIEEIEKLKEMSKLNKIERGKTLIYESNDYDRYEVLKYELNTPVCFFN